MNIGLKAGLIKNNPRASRTGNWRLNYEEEDGEGGGEGVGEEEEEEEEEEYDDDDDEDHDDKMYASVTPNIPRKVHECTDVNIRV